MLWIRTGWDGGRMPNIYDTSYYAGAGVEGKGEGGSYVLWLMALPLASELLKIYCSSF